MSSPDYDAVFAVKEAVDIMERAKRVPFAACYSDVQSLGLLLATRLWGESKEGNEKTEEVSKRIVNRFQFLLEEYDPYRSQNKDVPIFLSYDEVSIIGEVALGTYPAEEVADDSTDLEEVNWLNAVRTSWFRSFLAVQDKFVRAGGRDNPEMVKKVKSELEKK